MRSVHALWLLLLLGTLSQTPGHANQQASAQPVQDTITGLLHQTAELFHGNEQHDDTETYCPFTRATNSTPSSQLQLAIQCCASQLTVNANPARAPPSFSSLY